MTEKHQTNGYPEMQPTFTTAELKDITSFRNNFYFDVILTSVTMTNEISLRKSWRVKFIC